MARDDEQHRADDQLAAAVTVGLDAANERAALAKQVFSVKRRFLGMYKRANAGHIGSSLSCAELLVMLKCAWMHDDDTFLLSKGHAVAALYALLVETNRLDARALETFYGEGTLLPALPPVSGIEEIPFATGSLGHGLSLCAGMAVGAALKGSRRRFFCLTSDGELDEGSIWEAALFVAHRKLTNLVWLIDRNRIQGMGRTEEVLALEPLAAKLEAFGFHVIDTDGHDLGALLAARDACTRAQAGGTAPVAIIANTIKGRGLRSMQDSVASHYLPMDDAQYQQALDDLAGAWAADPDAR